MSRERGSATVVMAGVIGLLAVVSVATMALAMVYAARAQATSAADAAALAAAVATYPAAGGGTPAVAAAGMARANSAALLGCTCPVDDSLRPRTVGVVVGVTADVPVFGEIRVEAAARAEFDPMLWLGP